MKVDRKILVSGIGKRNALVRLLATECRRYGAEVIGCDASFFPPARLAVDRFEILPLASDPAFRIAYGDLLRREGVCAHLTLIDPEIPILGAMMVTGEAGQSRFLQPALNSAALCDDKYNFAIAMEANLIATIATSLAPLQTFPFIRKDRHGSASSGFHIFESSADLMRLEHENNGGDYIYQPFCSGTHYCIDAYFSLGAGGLIDLCAKKVLNKSKGESFLLESVAPARFIAFVKPIGAVIPLCGIVNFDIYDEGGTLKVMEINCRIGGNYPATHSFGCNLLRHMVDELFLPGGTTVPSFTDYMGAQLVAKYFDFSAPVSLRSASVPIGR